MSEDFPTRGFSVEVPSIVETQLTGWIGTARFARLGHTYAIKFHNHPPKSPEILRDGAPFEWAKMNATVRKVAYKAQDWFGTIPAFRAEHSNPNP